MAFYTRQAILDNIQKEDIIITPFKEANVGPNSYDLTLNTFYKVYENHELELGINNLAKEFLVPPTGIVMEPNLVYLFSTLEYITTKNCVGTIHARSSAARLGIDVVNSGGLGDVGYSGFWTLALSVKQPTKILPFARIAQMVFHKIYGEITEDYSDRKSSKYMNGIDSQGPIEYKPDK